MPHKIAPMRRDVDANEKQAPQAPVDPLVEQVSHAELYHFSNASQAMTPQVNREVVLPVNLGGYNSNKGLRLHKDQPSEIPWFYKDPQVRSLESAKKLG